MKRPSYRGPTAPDRARVVADRLEDLLFHLRDVVHEVRDGRVDPYASLYDARRRLTWLLRTMGDGEPVPGLPRHRWDDAL